MSYLTIKQIPKEDRPYEKCIKYGPKVLSDSELISIILKTGTRNYSVTDIAYNILKSPNGDMSLLSLYEKSFEDLKRIPGVGDVKAITLKCISEISERLHKATFIDRIKFDSPKVVADFFMEEMRHLKHEEFRVLFLNAGNLYLTHKTITKGTVNASLVSPREIFIEALNVGAVNIILIHNHPSGDVTPSSNDFEVTDKVTLAGDLLNINVLDHIIIGDNRYLSFKEINKKED